MNNMAFKIIYQLWTKDKSVYDGFFLWSFLLRTIIITALQLLTLCDDVASLDIRLGLRKEVRRTNALISKFKS